MRVLILGVFIFFFLNCNKKSTTSQMAIQFDSQALYGSWTILDALRNNRPTQTINGARFRIDSIQLSHNIFGIENTFGYTRKDSTLITHDQINYNIEFLNDSILIMNALIQKYNFRFSLKKDIKTELMLTETDSIAQ